MRSRRRILSNGLATVSAALFVATCVLLAWSRINPVLIIRLLTPSPTTSWDLRFDGWSMEIGRGEFTSNSDNYVLPIDSVYLSYWNVTGLEWRHLETVVKRRDSEAILSVVGSYVAFSFWSGYPILLSALLPATRFIQWFKTKRREKRKGHCPKCGYDLRATPGRCPECGTVPIRS